MQTFYTVENVFRDIIISRHTAQYTNKAGFEADGREKVSGRNPSA